MKLINLYVAEVGRRLPAGQRADIETELRSALEDALDDAAQQQGRPADEALAAEVLKRYGPPEKTAASYLPPRYLIGPELFPKYLKVLASLSGVLVLLAAIGFGADLGASAVVRADVPTALAHALAGLSSSFFIMIAVVTLIFGVFEWSSRRVEPPLSTWDPSMLKGKQDRDPDRVNPFELTSEIVFSIAALLVFNLYPQVVGFYWLQNGQWTKVVQLAPAFFQYLPWLNLWWGLQIVLNLIVLVQRRKQPLMHWFETGLEVLRIGLFFAIVLGPAMLQIDPATLASVGLGTLDAATLAKANEGVNTAVRVGLGIGAAVNVMDLARDVYKRVAGDRMHLAAQ